LRHKKRRPWRYVEPFAGGAGVGLRLLFDEHVDEIVLNDLNPGIAAFWRAVFEAPSDLAKLVRGCKPTVDAWHRQKELYELGSSDDLALGFATFYLNRTNRSGILGARPIGGFDQLGRWKINARWQAENLASRIELLGRYRSRVEITEQDGIDLVADAVGDNSAFVYADPPYIVNGDDLYLDNLRWQDHERLADTLRCSNGWLLTYDADDRVRDLYSGLRCASFGIAHTAATQHIGQEFAVFAPDLEVPDLALLGRGDARYLCA
jgi:DNA adenine methylase